MRKIIYNSVLVIVLISGVSWLQQNGSLNNSPIEKNKVEVIHLWISQNEEYNPPRNVNLEDYMKIVEWFNGYEASKISKEKPFPPDAQIIVNMQKGTIIIEYIDDRIYVQRNDTGRGLTKYEFIGDISELRNFFKELLTNI